jgi:hypothetical protein
MLHAIVHLEHFNLAPSTTTMMAAHTSPPVDGATGLQLGLDLAPGPCDLELLHLLPGGAVASEVSTKATNLLWQFSDWFFFDKLLSMLLTSTVVTCETVLTGEFYDF